MIFSDMVRIGITGGFPAQAILQNRELTRGSKSLDCMCVVIPIHGDGRVELWIKRQKFALSKAASGPPDPVVGAILTTVDGFDTAISKHQSSRALLSRERRMVILSHGFASAFLTPENAA
jgi:hypothetical protein